MARNRLSGGNAWACGTRAPCLHACLRVCG